MGLVRQSDEAECGLACLAMICSYFGHSEELSSLRNRFGCSPRGLSLGALSRTAQEIGFAVRPVKISLEEIFSWVGPPFILLTNDYHYVVLDRIRDGKAVVFDPAAGVLEVGKDHADSVFSGRCLFMDPPSGGFSSDPKRRAFPAESISSSKGLLCQLALLILATVGVEVLALILPWQIKVVIDSALLSSSYSTLGSPTLVLSVAVVGLFILTVSRSLYANRLGVVTVSRWTIGLLSHFLRLPSLGVSGRSVGDTMSRFSSLASVQHSLTNGLVDFVTSSMVVVGIGAILLYSSPRLALVVAIIVGINSLLRASVMPTTLRLNSEVVSLEAARQAEMVDTIRGAQSIQVYNAYEQRLNRFSELQRRFAEKELRLQNYMAFYMSTTQVVLATQRVALVVVGATSVSKGEISIGTLVAFMVYAEMFTCRISGLADRITDARMTMAHVKRVRDLAEQQTIVRDDQDRRRPCEVGVSVCSLGFKYPYEQRWVFKDVSFDVMKGEIVAIDGPSGVGKSTLVKIIAGVLKPSTGWIEIDGRRIGDIGADGLCCDVSSVLQEDYIFPGSIASNISFGDEHPLQEAVIRAAEAARISHEIDVMPMGYETLVGDSGFTLSGGQRQRILIARALYRSPSIVILDEATSNLDIANESAICRALKDLDLAVIIISHRPETKAFADRIIKLDHTVMN